MIQDFDTFFKKDRKPKKRPTLIIGALIFTGFIYWFVPPVWRLNSGSIPVTQLLSNKDNRQVMEGPDEKGWVRFDDVSAHVFQAIVIAEDARFYQHHGFDFSEIGRSISENFRKGRLARGASTITQQVVKMAFLTREKSFIRKIREAAGALLLENILEKNRILEWYVNLAEFGDGVYGIGAATQHYFQIKPEAVTLQQAIHLALVLPSPNVWSFGLQRRDLTDFGHHRFTQIADKLRRNGDITELEWLNVLAIANFGRPVRDYESIYALYLAGEDYLKKFDEEDLIPEIIKEQEQSHNNASPTQQMDVYTKDTAKEEAEDLQTGLEKTGMP